MSTHEDAINQPNSNRYPRLPEDVRKSIENAVYHPDPIRNQEIRDDILQRMEDFEGRKSEAYRLAAEQSYGA